MSEMEHKDVSAVYFGLIFANIVNKSLDRAFEAAERIEDKFPGIEVQVGIEQDEANEIRLLDGNPTDPPYIEFFVDRVDSGSVSGEPIGFCPVSAQNTTRSMYFQLLSFIKENEAKSFHEVHSEG